MVTHSSRRWTRAARAQPDTCPDVTAAHQAQAAAMLQQIASLLAAVKALTGNAVTIRQEADDPDAWRLYLHHRHCAEGCDLACSSVVLPPDAVIWSGNPSAYEGYHVYHGQPLSGSEADMLALLDKGA